MIYDESEELEGSFKINSDGDEPLDIPEDMNINDFGLDEEDPDRDS